MSLIPLPAPLPSFLPPPSTLSLSPLPLYRNCHLHSCCNHHCVSSSSSSFSSFFFSSYYIPLIIHIQFIITNFSSDLEGTLVSILQMHFKKFNYQRIYQRTFKQTKLPMNLSMNFLLGIQVWVKMRKVSII